MTVDYSFAQASADVIALYKPGFAPKLGIVLGSGLGEFAEQVEDATVIPYYKLPGFKTGSLAGHAGNLVLGYVKGTPVVCMQGRAHLYEGISSEIIKTMIRTLKLIGCEMLLLTNAAGSLRAEVAPGSLMLINDHINFQFTNILVGPNDDEFGPRFISMENAYNDELRAKAHKMATDLDINLAEGVYLAVSGPTFETPAEINAYRVLGADAVGMSTVPEVVIARHCDMRVLAISVITNLAAGMNDEVLSHEQTLRCAKLATADLTNLVLKFCEDYENGK